jgi:predicted flavoprotein YhiN
MESLVCKGLYLCGEILDIAGPVGGYNLQAAWSTGFVAGETAANAAKSVSMS